MYVILKKNISGEGGSCVFHSRLTKQQISCHKHASQQLQKEKYTAIFAFVQDCRCVYFAVCAVISDCVSYDLPASDEVLFTSVGNVSVH